MKRTISTILLCIVLLTLCSCGTKKVESKYHFGYKLDYIKENFPIDSLELFAESDSHVAYEKGEDDRISFIKYEDSDYVDYIMITASTKEDSVKYFEALEKEFDFFEEDADLIDDIKHQGDLWQTTYENTKVGISEPDERWNVYIIEMYKYKK